jgi:hypothetical protein
MSLNTDARLKVNGRVAIPSDVAANTPTKISTMIAADSDGEKSQSDTGGHGLTGRDLFSQWKKTH